MRRGTVSALMAVSVLSALGGAGWGDPAEPRLPPGSGGRAGQGAGLARALGRVFSVRPGATRRPLGKGHPKLRPPTLPGEWPRERLPSHADCILANRRAPRGASISRMKSNTVLRNGRRQLARSRRHLVDEAGRLRAFEVVSKSPVEGSPRGGVESTGGEESTPNGMA